MRAGVLGSRRGQIADDPIGEVTVLRGPLARADVVIPRQVFPLAEFRSLLLVT